MKHFLYTVCFSLLFGYACGRSKVAGFYSAMTAAPVHKVTITEILYDDEGRFEGCRKRSVGKMKIRRRFKRRLVLQGIPLTAHG